MSGPVSGEGREGLAAAVGAVGEVGEVAVAVLLRGAALLCAEGGWALEGGARAAAAAVAAAGGKAGVDEEMEAGEGEDWRGGGVEEVV